MKARDLAALAALGIAGKMAYDKFGNKKDEPKTRGELGKSKSANDSDAGESEARMDNYSNEGRNAKFTNEDYSNEGRGKAAPDYSNEGRGKTAPVAVAKPVRQAAVASRSLDSTGGPSRYNRAADSNDASTSFSSPEDAMAAYVPRRAPAAAVSPTFSSTEEGMQNYVPRRIPGAGDGVGPTFSSTEEGMQNYVPRRAPPAATFSSTEEGMQNYVPRRYSPATDSNTASSTAAGMANYVPRRTATASNTAAGMAAYVPRNAAAVEQARLDALRSSGGRRAKGGVVKMASGGLASSKMSKPSGASRGDGIAQRGRTRGKYL